MRWINSMLRICKTEFNNYTYMEAFVRGGGWVGDARSDAGDGLVFRHPIHFQPLISTNSSSRNTRSIIRN